MARTLAFKLGLIKDIKSLVLEVLEISTVCNHYTKHGPNIVRTIHQTVEKHKMNDSNA